MSLLQEHQCRDLEHLQPRGRMCTQVSPSHVLLLAPSLSSAEQLAAIPQFAGIGQLFKSSEKPVELTESETEYVVRCVKHCFQNYMVFQVRGEKWVGGASHECIHLHSLM